MQSPEHPVARKYSRVDGVFSTSRKATPGKRKELSELEFALAEANREAAQASSQPGCALPLFAKVIRQRQLAEVSTKSSETIRASLARSLSHTLTNLS